MAERYQFINYLETPVIVHVETQDRIEFCQLVDSTPVGTPEEAQTLHGPGAFDLKVPGGTIFGFLTDKTAVVRDPKIAQFVIRTTNGKVPWPQPPPLAPLLLAHVADFNERYMSFLEPAAQIQPPRHVDIPAQRGAMRNVRAILIAGDKDGLPGVPVTNVAEALDIIEKDLKERFSDGDVVIDRSGNSPTRARINKAFDRMRQIVEADDLFIVVFAGHGKADVVRDTQSWVLTKDESFSDSDLADALRKFPKDVDSVVISNCCFGEGAFDAEGKVMQQHSKILGNALHRSCTKCGTTGLNSPMVCISAASKHDEVKLANLDDLSRETVRAAAAKQSYNRLSEWFNHIKVAGRAFHVDARPGDRMNDLVLGTSSSTSASPKQVPRTSRPPVPSKGSAGETTLDKLLGELFNQLKALLEHQRAA